MASEARSHAAEGGDGEWRCHAGGMPTGPGDGCTGDMASPRGSGGGQAQGWRLVETRGYPSPGRSYRSASSKHLPRVLRDAGSSVRLGPGRVRQAAPEGALRSAMPGPGFACPPLPRRGAVPKCAARFGVEGLVGWGQQLFRTMRGRLCGHVGACVCRPRSCRRSMAVMVRGGPGRRRSTGEPDRQSVCSVGASSAREVREARGSEGFGGRLSRAGGAGCFAGGMRFTGPTFRLLVRSRPPPPCGACPAWGGFSRGCRSRARGARRPARRG